MTKVYDSAMILIMALLVFGIVLALGGVTPELLAPSFFLGLLLLVIWGGRILFRSEQPLKRSPMHLPGLLFLGYALARFLTAPIEYEGRVEMFQLALCAAVYFICANEFRSPTHRRALVFLLAALAVFESMYGIWQAVTKTDAIFHWVRSESYRGRASGTYVCPNHLAGCLEIILGLIVARLALVKMEVASFEQSMIIKVGLIYAMLVSAAGIIFSQSRGGWVAATGGLVLLTIWGRKFSVNALLRLTALVVVLAGIAALVLTSETGQRRLAETFKRDAPSGELRLRDLTLGGRIVLWTGTWQMIKEAPVFGTGPGTWQWLYQPHKEARLKARAEYAHNDYLNLLSDYGIIGTLLVAWFFVGFYRQAWILSRADQLLEQRAFAVGAVAAVTAILIHSAFDFNLHIPGNAVLLAAIMGTMTAMDDKAVRYPARIIRRGRFALAAAALAVSIACGVLFVPTVISAHYADLGWGYKGRLEYEAALHYYRKAIAADLKSPQPQIRLGEIYLVQTSLRVGPEKEAQRRELALLAVEAFDHALRLNPFLVAAWLGRARGFEMANDEAQALDSYQKALQVDPVNPSAYFRIGWIYRNRGDQAKAEAAFEESQRLRDIEDMGAQLNLHDLRNR
jgi:O-antigen ligase